MSLVLIDFLPNFVGFLAFLLLIAFSFHTLSFVLL